MQSCEHPSHAGTGKRWSFSPHQDDRASHRPSPQCPIQLLRKVDRAQDRKKKANDVRSEKQCVHVQSFFSFSRALTGLPAVAQYLKKAETPRDARLKLWAASGDLQRPLRKGGHWVCGGGEDNDRLCGQKSNQSKRCPAMVGYPWLKSSLVPQH
jgi:hypothetical protein